MHWYYIYANISGRAKWHMVYDRHPGLYFVEEDFEEEEYDIELYREEFPHNEVVEIPNVNEVRQPLGLCPEHAKMWGRMDCPLCDFLFVYDRLDLAIRQMQLSLGELKEDDVTKAKKRIRNFLEYCQVGNKAPCTCGEVGESRCNKHGLHILAEQCKEAKEQ